MIPIHDHRNLYSFNYLSLSTAFMNIARWATDCDVDPHIVEVIYDLLDDNCDGYLDIKELSPVLFQWRRSRGFVHQSIEISLGQLKISG